MAEQLQAQLTIDYRDALRGAAQLEKALQDAATVQVSVETDTRQARKELDALGKGVTASLGIDTQAALKAADRVQARFRQLALTGRVDLDDSDTLAAVKQLEVLHSRLDGLQGRVDVDDSELRSVVDEIAGLDRQLDSLSGRVTVDDSDLTSARAAVDGLAGELKSVGSAAGGASGGVGQLASGFGSLKQAATGAGFAAVALGIKDVTFAAADLGEQVSRSGVVWGEQSEAIQSFSKDLRGIPTTEALTFANGLGSQLLNLGFAADQAAASTQTLIQRAVDLGSQNNIDTAQSIEAITAALRGEYEQAEQVNVFLSDQIVRQKAVELGLASSTAAVDQHAKAQATMALFLEQSARAKGDFDRTFDSSLPNQLKQINKSFEDAKVSIGNVFLPIAVDAAKKIQEIGRAASGVLGALDSFAKKLGGTSTAQIKEETAATEKLIEARYGAAKASEFQALAEKQQADQSVSATSVLKGAFSSLTGLGDTQADTARKAEEANKAFAFSLSPTGQAMEQYGASVTATTTALAGIVQASQEASFSTGNVALSAEEQKAAFEVMASATETARDRLLSFAEAADAGFPTLADAVSNAQLTVDSFSMDKAIAELQRITQARIDLNSNLTTLISQGFDDVARQALTLPPDLQGVFVQQALADPANLPALEAKFQNQASALALSGAQLATTQFQTGFNIEGVTTEKALAASGALQTILPSGADIAGAAAALKIDQTVLTKLLQVGATEVTPTIDADAQRALNQTDRVRTDLNDIDRTTVSSTVDADTNGAQSAISAVVSGLNSIPSNVETTVTVNASVQGAINAAQEAANAIAAMFRFTGGDVAANTPYIVNELGSEGFISSSGNFQWIRGGPQVRTFNQAGTVIPHTIAPQVAQAASTGSFAPIVGTHGNNPAGGNLGAVVERAVTRGIKAAPILAAVTPPGEDPAVGLRRLARRTGRALS